jgi:hypothetical protein
LALQTTTKDSSISKTDRREKDNGIFKSPAQKNHTQPPRNGYKTNQKPKVEPIEVDLIRVKSKDQIPIQTFWNAIEPYFKTLSENERELLLEEVCSTDGRCSLGSTIYHLPTLHRVTMSNHI